MSSLRQAFESLLAKHNREVTISRPGTVFTGTIKVTPSNYSRILEVAGTVTEQGREFIITKSELERIGFPQLRKGDRLLDAEIGTSVISSIAEMPDFGGTIMGYRVRTS